MLYLGIKMFLSEDFDDVIQRFDDRITNLLSDNQSNHIDSDLSKTE